MGMSPEELAIWRSLSKVFNPDDWCNRENTCFFAGRGTTDKGGAGRATFIAQSPYDGIISNGTFILLSLNLWSHICF